MKTLQLLLFSLLAAIPTVGQSANVAVEIGRVGTRLKAGAVEVDVTVTCRAGRAVLEAFVYVVQNQSESEFAPIPWVCRGFPRTYIVKVPAGETLIKRGDASASAFVLLEIPNTFDTETGDDSRPLRIR